MCSVPVMLGTGIAITNSRPLASATRAQLGMGPRAARGPLGGTLVVAATTRSAALMLLACSMFLPQNSVTSPSDATYIDFCKSQTQYFLGRTVPSIG